MGESEFRNFITADGTSGFKAESGRYHLYVSHACPFAHRTLITRKMKGLEDVISYTVMDILKFDKGWRFNEKTPLCGKDPVFGAEYLRDIYERVTPGYTGRITVPILFDKLKKTIVSNDSAEIIRVLTSQFNAFCNTEEQRRIDLYPEHLREKIDGINAWVFRYINNGVYVAGFAKAQAEYDRGVIALFDHLDKVEGILANSRYLIGDQITEADVRLYTTLIRFDKVYHGHYKCNKKRIIDYPNIWGYLRDLYTTYPFKETTNFEHITI